MKKHFAVPIIVFCVLSVAAFGYQVIERYRLGAVVEGITYISSGPLAGKVALIDGWNVYLHDPALGNYEKAFSVAGTGFLTCPRGIAFLSQGEFAGCFLMTDTLDPDTLYLFTATGTLISTVQAQGFEWSNAEGLTQVTSGLYQGKIAVVHHGTSPNDWSFHIYILRLEKNGGHIQAFLDKDISNQLKYGLGIAFLPADFPDPAYRNMFAVTTYDEDDNPLLEVYDVEGNLKSSSPCFIEAEGLTYVSAGSLSGRLLIVDRYLLQPAYRNLDGSVSTPASTPAIGLGVHNTSHITWLKDRQQFHVIGWDGQFNNLPGYLISRPFPGAWNLDEHFHLTHFKFSRSITDLTADGTYKLFGYFNQNRYGVDRLDASFNLLGTTPLPDSYAGKRFPCLVYVPGETPDSDRYIAPLDKTIYSFDPLFSDAATIFDISGSVTNNINRLCYDPDLRRYYVLDGTWLRVFDAHWNLIGSFDLLEASPGAFTGIAKITTGDLRGNVVVVSGDDNELIALNFEYEIAGCLLQSLIDEVLASGLDKGRTNSLVQKLKNALRSVEEERATPAINQVEAFQNEVGAQRGKDISAVLADRWTTLSADVIRGLQALL